jgi:hypothetical protein
VNNKKNGPAPVQACTGKVPDHLSLQSTGGSNPSGNHTQANTFFLKPSMRLRETRFRAPQKRLSEEQPHDRSENKEFLQSKKDQGFFLM